MGAEEQTDVVEVLARLLALAEQRISESEQSDPIYALIGAYQSGQPLADNIPVSEDPDLYLARAASGDLH